MEITQVHYERLVNLGDYETERIGAWAAVEEGDGPDQALADLTAWVDNQVSSKREQKDTLVEAEQKLATLQYQIEQTQREYGTMRETWKRTRQTLKKFGLDVPRSYINEDDEDGIPF